jgi:hypothetical protein
VKCGNAALGLLHLLRDLAAQADDGHGLLVQALRIALVDAASTRLRLRGAGHIGVQVLVRDATGRAGARHELQLNTRVPGLAAHGRGGDGLVVRARTSGSRGRVAAGALSGLGRRSAATVRLRERAASRPAAGAARVSVCYGANSRPSQI